MCVNRAGIQRDWRSCEPTIAELTVGVDAFVIECDVFIFIFIFTKTAALLGHSPAQSAVLSYATMHIWPMTMRAGRWHAHRLAWPIRDSLCVNVNGSI